MFTCKDNIANAVYQIAIAIFFHGNVTGLCLLIIYSLEQIQDYCVYSVEEK